MRCRLTPKRYRWCSVWTGLKKSQWVFTWTYFYYRQMFSDGAWTAWSSFPLLSSFQIRSSCHHPSKCPYPFSNNWSSNSTPDNVHNFYLWTHWFQQFQKGMMNRVYCKYPIQSSQQQNKDVNIKLWIHACVNLTPNLSPIRASGVKVRGQGHKS